MMTGPCLSRWESVTALPRAFSRVQSGACVPSLRAFSAAPEFMSCPIGRSKSCSRFVGNQLAPSTLSLCDDLSGEDHDNVPINKKSEGLFNENFSIAQTNRRRFTRRAAISRGGRNSSRVGTLRARDLPRVLHPCERTRESRIDVRKCEHRGRQRGARHVTIRAVTPDRL